MCCWASVLPRKIFRGFADPIIFLFLGSFLIAEAMLQHGLNRRIAFGIMRGVGTSPKRLLAAFGISYRFRFIMGVQYGDDGDDASDRAGDPQREPNATGIWNGAYVDDGIRHVDLRLSGTPIRT